MPRTTIPQLLLDKLVDLAGEAARERALRFEAEDKLHKAEREARSAPGVADVDALMDALSEQRLIEGIKAYRVLTGSGLKESKDAVERVLGRIRPAA
jgi:ribosomal protein L7/L12